jgi:chromosomal replication initiation ATPase DnaA
MQPSLPLSLPPAETLPELIIGEGNRLAYRLLFEDTGWGSSALYLQGEAGCGKSLLAQMWAEKQGAVFLPAALDDAFIASLTTGVYVLDPLAGESLPETALFHLLNLVKETGSRLLICSRIPVAALPITLPDLVSRLRALPVATIFAPDDTMLAALLMQQFATRQLRVESGIIPYLLSRIPRSFAAAIAVVEKLDHLSLAAKRSITLPLVRQALESWEQ